MNHLIYKITNSINSKIYIGAHSTNKVDDVYMGSGMLLNKDQKEFGIEKFKKEILFNFDTQDEMLLKEKELVNKDFVSREDTYNICLGGSPITWFKHTVVKDTNGNTFAVHVNDPRFLSGELVSVHKNQIVCIDEYGKFVRVSKDQYHLKNYRPLSKDFVTAKDTDGKTLRVRITDVRYVSGYLKPYWSGRNHSEDTKSKISKSAKSRTSNSQTGTCWIYSNDEMISKKIKNEELYSFTSLGWIKGRKINWK